MAFTHTNETDLSRVTNILGLNIHKYTKKEVVSFIEQKMCSNNFSWIATINPELCLISLNDPQLKALINSASLSVCDGIGTFFAAKIIHEPVPEKICGSDLIHDICFHAQKYNKSILFLGSTESTLYTLSHYLKKAYPDLTFYTDARITKNNSDSYTCATERIKETSPDVVCVALGAPYQEKYIAEYLAHIPCITLAIGVGGALDMIAGKKPRAPHILQILGFEWLWRVCIEPQRINRIMNAVCVFPYTFICYSLRMRFCYRKNVIACIKNNKNDILIIERADTPGHWQLPQGGIEKGETIQAGFLREMKEEIGLNNFSVQKIVPTFFTYPWPKWHQLNRGYRGQKQSLVIATLSDTDTILLDPVEARTYAWVSQDNLVTLLHPIRQEMGVKLISYLRGLSPNALLSKKRQIS